MGVISRISLLLLVCCLSTNALFLHQEPYPTRPPGSNTLGLFFFFGDTNNDLHLDRDELMTLFSADIYQGQGFVIAYILLQLDADGDNMLNETEFQAGLSLSENEFRRRMA